MAWRLPTTTLNITERKVLEYLSEVAEECGIERTNLAVGECCFPSAGIQKIVRSSKTLRLLHAMGLVERVRRYGVQYWNRVEDDGKGERSREVFVDHDADSGIFSAWKTCAAFQGLAAAHPTPLTLKEVDENVLCGEGLGRTEGIMNMLIRGGFAESNDAVRNHGPLLYWPTEKGLGYWEKIREVNSKKWKVLEHLRASYGHPEKCRIENIARDCLGIGKHCSNERIYFAAAKVVKELMEERYIYAVKHPVERWIWYRVVGIDSKPGSKPKKKG